MNVGYARVSSTDQNLARQEESLKKVKCQKIFFEKISGKDTNRSELKRMLLFIRESDVVIVTSLDRLGRNANDIRRILNQIKKKGAAIRILDLPSFAGVEDANLQNLLTNVILELMTYVAQSEREKIRERQKEGITIAKRKGIYIGKQREYSNVARDPQKRLVYQAIVRGLKNNDSVKSLSKINGVSRNTVYRIKSELDSNEDGSGTSGR